MRWSPSDVSVVTVSTSEAINVSTGVRDHYTVTLTAFTDTTITSTLSRTAEDGITVSCVDPTPNVTAVGSTMIRLVGELLLLKLN